MQRRMTPPQWQGLLKALDALREQRQVITYRALIEHLQLPAPAMATLTAALEQLAAHDARCGQPLRSALVVSQANPALPRPGFFACAVQLGCYAGPLEGCEAADWHARERQRVYDHRFEEAP
ncbi:hypothetical protein [Pseudomonas sp. NW5]|uniref:hypothetical protein n=1 Tax=Pseudomonas sp. NW5 TaxID=2934934 RepID=UPI0020224581|nr:hypothetical protein [Pseudomonas sp. NW5]MCL7462865.1 hypothetical protein [Pseudomonas sp. NW5]